MDQDNRIETAWRFGAIVGGVLALLILVIVLVIGITLLRRYLHNKQRKHCHYSQHVEDGGDVTTSKGTTFSRVTFGVLWSSRQVNNEINQSSAHINNGPHDVKPHAFAMVTEPSNQSSCELHLQSEDTIRVIPTTTPTTVVLQVEPTTSEHEDEEAVYYELENPTEAAPEELTRTRSKSSNSYTSISSEIQKLPPPPIMFPPHRRGRRHSLPNNLLPAVTQNTTAQFVTTDNPNHVNYRYGRRNSDPSVIMVPPPALLTPGTASSPVEYEKPMSSYMSLDLSSVVHHSYTALHMSSDPNTPTEPVGFPRQQLSIRTRLPINHMRMNSIPEENNYERLNPLPKPSLIRSHDQQ